MKRSQDSQVTFTPVEFDPFADGEVLVTALATESQREIWASVQMGKEANCAYNESQSLKLKGDLVLTALETALQELIQRHEALRTTFSADGISVCIADSYSLNIPLIDLSDLNVKTQQLETVKWQQQAVNEEFDLEKGPLFRVQILKLKPQEHLIILTAHHIICDGWSWAVLINDLGQLYSVLKQGITPELEEVERFSDYALMLETQSQSEEEIASEAYWLEQFKGNIPVLDLPVDRPRPPVRSFNSQREDWELSPKLVSNLKQLATQLNCSFMTILLTSFEVWLHRITGQSDLVVGVLAAGQAATGMYNLVGHCVNLLPMRSWVEGEQSFQDYVESRRKNILDAYDRQQFTFGTLVQKLAIPRDISRIPLVPVLFNIDKGLESDKLPFEGLSAELFSNPRSFENFELFVNATELNGKLTLECQYNINLFEANTIRRRLAEFETLLTSIVSNPKEKISTLPLLPTAELELLASWNQTESQYPQDLCVHQLIEKQVEVTPDVIAVRLNQQVLTYKELEERSNQLARHLQTLGINTETLVGISIERTPEMLVAMLGVLKAGGAYVPLDPYYPSSRIALVMADAHISVLLTQSNLVEQLPKTQAQTICLDRDWQKISQHSIERLSCNISPDNLAYVIYTSGSTGTPKGVQVPHRGVVNFLNDMQKQPGIDREDILLSVTTLSFDIAVLELLLPLTVGATTVLVEREVAMDGRALLKTIENNNVTLMQGTPATWQIMLAAGWQQQSKSLQKIISGGEALSSELAKELLARAKSVWNLYGPTETTIWSTRYEVETADSPISIGRAIANTQLYILDSNLQAVPIGIAGELHIGGVGVTRGYLNRPELTTEKFIPNPFSLNPQECLYKTGDLARFLPNGRVEYLGRIDYQVKVRGFRIELGEIESAMLRFAGVKEAVAIAREETPGEKTLVGYLVADESVNLETSELRKFLKEKLPEYMIPSLFMMLEAMPLTPNGKVDRKSLPIPNLNYSSRDRYVAPRNHIEQNIAEIWSEVLKVDHIGVHDNFFDLGGHSLLATQIVSRLFKVFQIRLSLLALFEVPTVAELAERIETMNWILEQSSVNEKYGEGEYIEI